MTIGFIGQGYVGKNYADDFERRGIPVIRYSLEEPYIQNKDKISTCDIVFIAVPTPTTPAGFDVSIVREKLQMLRPGAIAVIKSTILPGTTEALQKEFPNLIVMHSPEFLSKATAAHNAANPFSNIIGIVGESTAAKKAAQDVLALLPEAPHTLICTSTEAEIIKYANNVNGYAQIVFFNMLYDTAATLGGDWGKIQEALDKNPHVSSYYINPYHKSGRGAGGYCFIKDFAAFRSFYENLLAQDEYGVSMLRAMENKNIELLRTTNKDLNILQMVYTGETPKA